MANIRKQRILKIIDLKIVNLKFRILLHNIDNEFKANHWSIRIKNIQIAFNQLL